MCKARREHILECSAVKPLWKTMTQQEKFAMPGVMKCDVMGLKIFLDEVRHTAVFYSRRIISGANMLNPIGTSKTTCKQTGS